MSEPSNILIRDMPQDERPRERLVQHGADQLKNAELLAILLRTGYKGNSAVHVAERLLSRFEKLEALARAPLEELIKIKGIGRDKAIALKSAFTLARRMAMELREELPLVETPDQVRDVLWPEVVHLQAEEFRVLLVNVRKRLLRIERIGIGTLDSVLVHPREVFRPAILSSAASIILAHNHPSGDPSPSEADIRITRDMIRVGHLMRIEVLDHIIIGARTPERLKDYVSLRELGYFHA